MTPPGQGPDDSWFRSRDERDPGAGSALPPAMDPRGPRHARQRSGETRPDGRRATPRSTRGTAPGGGRARRVLAWTAAVMAVLVLGVSGAGYGLLSYSEHRIKRVDVFGGLKDRPQKKPNDAVTYLVVGSDKREGLSPEELKRLRVGRATAANGSGQRSDTMMLVHISADRSRALIVSLPRDSYVEIPPHKSSSGRQIGVTHNKLNAAFSFGGPSLLIQTVEKATGVRIDHYVEVNFAGFVGMVDALGGVDICTPKAVKDAKAHLDLSAGSHHLDGVDSLKYVRARYFDGQGDLGRMRRQQQFIGAMINQATSAGVLLNPVKLTSFVNAALDSVETDPDLSRGDVVALAEQMRNISAHKVATITVPIGNQDYRPPGLGGASTVLWDDALATQLFTAINEDRPVGTPAKAPKVTAEVPPAQVRVRVQNGAGVAGLAGKAAADFRSAGFSVLGKPSNAPDQGLKTTVVRYDPRWSRSVKTLQAALPGAEFREVQGLGGTFEVWLGSSYKGVSKVTVSTASPSPSSSTGTLQTHSAADDPCKG